MKGIRKTVILLCVLFVTVSLSACGKTETKDTSSGDAGESKKTAQATKAPTEAPQATKEPEIKVINKTFLSKSKVKNKYQAGKKTVKSAKAASSLKSWKKGGVKEQLVKFVNRATDKKSDGYIPPEDRIVVSDIDGTLIAEKGQKVDNDDMVMKTPGEVRDYLLSIQDDYFDTDKKLRYRGILYQPMAEMFDYLEANGFQIYFVSGNCNSLTYAWADYYFGADYAHSIGSNIDLAIDETEGFQMGPTGSYEGCWEEMKSFRIYNQIGKCPVLAFGNSSGDVQMLAWVQSNPDYQGLSVMINHDDEREYVYSVDSISKFCDKYHFVDAKISENFQRVFINSNSR